MFLFVGASQISFYISAFVLGTLLLPISNSFIIPKQLLFSNLSIWLSMAFLSLSLCSLLCRNRAAQQDHESGLHSTGCFSFLLHWLHDLTLDRIWYQRMEDPPCSSVHDIRHLHPPVVVRCLACWLSVCLVGSNWDVNCAGSSLSLLAGWSPRVEWRKQMPLWEMLHERTKSRRHQLYLKGLW